MKSLDHFLLEIILGFVWRSLSLSKHGQGEDSFDQKCISTVDFLATKSMVSAKIYLKFFPVCEQFFCKILLLSFLPKHTSAK